MMNTHDQMKCPICDAEMSSIHIDRLTEYQCTRCSGYSYYFEDGCHGIHIGPHKFSTHVTDSIDHVLFVLRSAAAMEGKARELYKASIK